MNTPVYNDKGQRIGLKNTWRIPARPFAKAECCGEVKRIGFGTYRCQSCWAKLWPERLYHRLWNRDWQRIFKTVRWTKW